jgi:5-dehydro-2-deoxygluconokinase
LTSPAAWRAAGAAISAHDPLCRGVVVLGLDAPEAEILAAFAAARTESWVKGFAVGRTIFADPFRAWLKNEIDDAGAVAAMARRFGRLCDAWRGAR